MAETPAFLTEDGIRGWIMRSVAAERTMAHRAEIKHLGKLNEIEKSQIEMRCDLRALSGFGHDLGSVGRLAKALDEFIAEQRASNVAANDQRVAQAEQIQSIAEAIKPIEAIHKTSEQTKKQVGEMKQIPRIIRDLWKLIIGLIGGVLLMMTVWGKLHPPQIKITREQVEQLQRPAH